MMDSGVSINNDVTMRDDVSGNGVKRFRSGDVILGRYVVESELGQGGMGVVYLCLDKIGGVKVAVKGLPPEVSHNSDEMESVRENFQLVSELRHPNIAGVRTLERDASTGNYYLVMAFARGTSLKHWLRKHRGSEHRAKQLKVLRQIASALDYAHNAEPRHIIHRDIKPENVMVDELENVMVLDFGLAAQVRSSLSRVSQIVTSRSGTPAYKSPEQWLAQAQRAPSDQYSLGVIAYQMFSGELPFDSDDIEILKHAVVFDRVPEIANESKDINTVFAKVLGKKPQERFDTCLAFVDALEGRRPGASATSVKTVFACVMTILAALGGIVGFFWWEKRNGEERAKESARQIELAKSESARQKAKTEQMAAELRKIEAARVAAEKDEAERKAKVEAERIAEERARSIERETERAAFRLSAQVESAYGPIKIQTQEAKLQFASEIRAFEDDRNAGDRAKEVSKNALATNLYVSALSKANALKAMFGQWNDYASAMKEATICRDAAVRDGLNNVEETRYEDALVQMDLAEASAKERKFADAAAKAKVAKQGFDALRADAIKQTLRLAQDSQKAERWQECSDAAKKVLGWDPQNAAAHAIKRAADIFLRHKIGETKTIVLPGGAKMELVWCPPGSFTMGSPKSEEGRGRDEQQHRVTLTQGFWMGKYEVTQRQWESVMRSNPSRVYGADNPVDGVSWDDCQLFVGRINASQKEKVALPTEAQWEYACRAGTEGAYAGRIERMAWYGGNSTEGTHPVGEKDPNAWGLFDMHGNVIEWCSDWYGDYEGDATDPAGPTVGEKRVTRGGAWCNKARFCRSSVRSWYMPSRGIPGLGFRIICLEKVGK